MVYYVVEGRERLVVDLEKTQKRLEIYVDGRRALLIKTSGTILIQSDKNNLKVIKVGVNKV